MSRIVVPVVICALLIAFVLPPVSAYSAVNRDHSSAFSGSTLLAKSDNKPTPHATPAVRSTPAPARTTTPSSGEVTIGSSPVGAKVYIDGSYRGTTPLSLRDISSGPHTLRLVLDGYTDFSGGLSVSSGKVTDSFVPLIPIVANGSASPGFRWDDPVVLLTILGIVVTVVGAVVTIVSMMPSKKKE